MAKMQGDTMIDTLYVLGTIGFFALMFAYVAACARLGRGTGEEEPRS